MVIFKKYESNLILNVENIFNFKGLVTIDNKVGNINYLFTYKSKFLRNFIYIYSIFLSLTFFSYFNYKNNPEFKLKLPLKCLLVLNNNFFF